ncbi:succinyl-CoA:glutarate CoA-transferase isoform X11 [Heliangelus exortis]|uniref:succinyl-CoA:glutarate CoA-transferase isoform X11 n=1 Tax=Heliangelus exortis TaxID=472823 RepID=UPI003A8F6461
MLRAGLGGRIRRCGGSGLWRSPCPAAAGSSVPPRCPGALSAASASPSTGGGARGGGAPPAGASNVKPLDGVKILDLTRVLAGPFATMNLGDLGAEVIKVEKPGIMEKVFFLFGNSASSAQFPLSQSVLGAGDDTRAWGPPFAGTESVYFLSINRNKKSIAVNMKDSKGVKLIRELAAVSDVFVENYVPGKLAEMGLGYEDIKKIAPHIVYCSITGYGQTGPMVQRGGYDSIAAAVSGLMHITGHEDGEPVRPGVAMTDLATGLYTYGAIMAGLLQRYKTGKGLHIDCNLLSSQAFKTMDGYFVVGAGNDKQFVTVCKVLHNGLVMEMNHPTAGRIAVPGPGVRYSEFAVSHPKPPPLVGQHTVEILKGMLGYEDDAIEELLCSGAVAQHEIVSVIFFFLCIPGTKLHTLSMC